ncbi:MAG: hypothetical protein KJ017_10730 [Alphaproteobacteria bacterium]|nr:hypothetical protein [Alphaproteobacteria bacterium]
MSSVQEGLDLLNSDPNTMFAFIPLSRTQALEAFTANIRDKALCSFFAGVFNEETKGYLGDMFPEAHAPLLLEPSKSPGDYLVVPTRRGVFNDLSNRPVSLEANLPGDLHIHKVAIQSDNRRSISRNLHRDTAILTVNIYSEGDPLRYRIGGHMIHIKAPAIFMHRGIKHPFGIDAAVEHQGREQTGARANVAYEYDYGAPSVGIDVY